MDMKQTASYSKLEKIVEQLKHRGVRAEICRRVVKVTETVNGSNPSYAEQQFTPLLSIAKGI